MNELQVFNNAEFGQLRTTVIDGLPWAVGKDVALALGYVKPTDAVRKHVDDEDQGISKMETPSGMQDTVIINESGIYSLIFASKLPSAKRFRRWVTTEVLPAIRANGCYTPGESKGLTPTDYVKAAQLLATCDRDRLPYVTGLLSRAGIVLPSLAERPQSRGRDQTGETARYIRLAVSSGISLAEIGRRVGLHRQQIYRYAHERTHPSVDRMNAIIDAVRDALPDIET